MLKTPLKENKKWGKKLCESKITRVTLEIGSAKTISTRARQHLKQAALLGEQQLRLESKWR
jgi:hypothetical protein